MVLRISPNYRRAGTRGSRKRIGVKKFGLGFRRASCISRLHIVINSKRTIGNVPITVGSLRQAMLVILTFTVTT